LFTNVYIQSDLVLVVQVPRLGAQIRKQLHSQNALSSCFNWKFVLQSGKNRK
jgi:hypothetical protein